jgi:hypothetical protein
MQSKGPNVLFWDIETAQNLVALFSLMHNDYVDPSNIIRERYMISAAWLWNDESKVHSVSVLDDPKRYDKNPHDDYHVVKTLYDVLSQADVIIGHNADSYDKKWLDTRALVHGLKPLPPITSIDTLKVAKKRFALNSNKLDYIAKLLRVGEKIPTTPGLWLRVLAGDKKAIREMVTYNRHDVEVTRSVFKKLQPYCDSHINRELFGKTGCPRCGSTKVQSRGVHRAITKTYQRFCCNDCGGWFRELRSENKSTKYRVI